MTTEYFVVFALGWIALGLGAWAMLDVLSQGGPLKRGDERAVLLLLAVVMGPVAWVFVYRLFRPRNQK
jgi:hypothetical protein